MKTVKLNADKNSQLAALSLTSWCKQRLSLMRWRKRLNFRQLKANLMIVKMMTHAKKTYWKTKRNCWTRLRT